MRQNRLEAAAEVAEVVPILMHLDSLPIVLDLREHAVRTLLHRMLDGLAGLSLGVGKDKPGDLQVLSHWRLLSGDSPRVHVPGNEDQRMPSGLAQNLLFEDYECDSFLKSNKLPLKQHFTFFSII